jgi:elongation factor G
MTLLVTVPETCTGDIMKGLTERRGRVLGIEPAGNGKQQISAEVPESELYGYCTALRSATGGAGEFSYTFARYEQAPKM